MSDKVFASDTVRLILNTGKVLSTFTLFKIKYKKPNGIKGSWIADIYPTNNKCLYADVTFDSPDIWKVQAYVSKNNESYHGMWADVKVYSQLAPTTTLAPTTVAPTTAPPTTMVPTT